MHQAQHMLGVRRAGPQPGRMRESEEDDMTTWQIVGLVLFLLLATREIWGGWIVRRWLR